MSDDALDRLRPALSGGYAIEREIERGGMAVVFLAEDLKHRRKVAIKVLQPALAATLATERFLREINVIAKLQHPHILTLIDSGAAEGLPYYVMPFVEGQSLKERLQGEGVLALETAIRIAAEVADALAYAHEKGIIHRDIKPGNVLLSADHAIVADFGIATALDEAALGSLTDTGVSIGSPEYMSPEQASGDRGLDGRSDVYALGCVLYEMLGGKAPFEGSIRTLLTRKISGKIPPLRELRPDLPPRVGEVVSRAMAVAPADRFETAGAFRDALVAALPAASPRARLRTRAIAVTASVAAVAALVAVLFVRSAGERALWAAQTLAEVENLVERGRYTAALALAQEVEAAFPDDTTLARLLPRFTIRVPIHTDPPGARVYIQNIESPETDWQELGVTPLEEVRFAGWTADFGDSIHAIREDQPYRVRFQLDGYQERDLYLSAVLGVAWRGIEPMDPVVLTRLDPDLEGMARIPGFSRLVGVETITYQDFFIDRFEVTNRQFKQFVDAGGYQRPDYWIHPFVRDGEALAFEQAMALFEDPTGRAGPSTWRLGTYPDGQQDHPVGGVSWYEAAAYARWAGKQLPTKVHWDRTRMYTPEDNYLVDPLSNLGSAGPRQVGENRAMNTLGVHDLGGNVREWGYNEAGEDMRATWGGSWSDPPFLVMATIPKPAFDRDATNGFRLMRTSESEESLSALRTPVQRTLVRDYATEKPASDAEFQVFRRLHDYDPVPLNAVVEQTDTAEHWIREKVTFDLPYGERGGVVLYLPKDVRPPYQTIVYWGGSGLMVTKSIDEEYLPGFDFMVRSGRVVALPIFAGAYGRVDPRPTERWGTSAPTGSGDNAFRDISIKWVQDLRVSIDYLETRADIDSEHLGYFGYSFGGQKAPQILALEPRLRAAVLNVGGLMSQPHPPEVDGLNFVTRVQTPTLMINGRYDIVFPFETNQVPMFELLGTPPEHKQHYTTPAAHIVPQDDLFRLTFDWFDKYLGVPPR